MSSSTRRSNRRTSGGLKPQREIVEEQCPTCEPIAHGEDRIYCVQYGARRKSKFPAFFFCHECDLAEEYFCTPSTLGKWPPNWATSRYRCKASHHNPDHPKNDVHGWAKGNVKISQSFEKSLM